MLACTAAIALVLARRNERIDTAPTGVLAMTGAPSSVAATNETPLPLHFSDGSEVTLATAARACITKRSEAGASVMIERGGLHAKIHHRADTAWRFQAGPYDVRVTGTAFSLSWDPMSASMVLGLEEGSVVVTGCNMDERRVSAGEELRVRCELAADSGAVLPTAESAPLEPPTDAGHGLSHASAPPSAQRVIVPSPSAPGPSWRGLAASARYREAYEAAQHEGLDDIARTASAPDLLSIANAARLTRHERESDALLTAIRRRFPGTVNAAVAAFMLGRSAMDGPGAYAEAATWFETSVREQPDGALAREAAGLFVESSDRSGDRARARVAASAYLQRYPTGPHAELAHRVLGRGTEPK